MATEGKEFHLGRRRGGYIGFEKLELTMAEAIEQANLEPA